MATLAVIQPESLLLFAPLIERHTLYIYIISSATVAVMQYHSFHIIFLHTLFSEAKTSHVFSPPNSFTTQPIFISIVKYIRDVLDE